MSRIDNISNALAASLSFGFQKEASDIQITHEDEKIRKYAGINIYQPTIDNIEMFVRKYLMNELAFFPKITNIGIDVTPSKFNSEKKEYIDEGSGVASVLIDNVKLEFPFMITDGEMVPFDVIQLGKQRVPYTRENLKKILFGISNQKKSTSPVKEFEPYIKVERPVNPTSSIGFLGDVLRIQEQYQGHSNGGGVYVTAEAVDNLLEKVATMQTLSAERLAAIERLVHDNIANKEVESLKKEAKEIEGIDAEIEKVSSFMQRISEVDFRNAATLPNGTLIKFPEIHKNEITMTSGVVIDNYMDFAGWFPKPMKIVVSMDGRMKILENGDVFLCLESGDRFNIPLSYFDQVQQGDVILAFDGNKALYPSKIEWIRNRFMKPQLEAASTPNQSVESPIESTAVGLVGTKIYDLRPITKESRLMTLFADNGANRSGDFLPGEELSIKIAPMDGPKFVEMPYNDYLKKKSEELGMDESILSSLVSPSDIVSYHKINRNIGRNMVTSYRDVAQDNNIVICTDPKTKVLIVKGVITGYIKSANDLANKISSEPEFEVNAEENINSIEKEARADADGYRDAYDTITDSVLGNTSKYNKNKGSAIGKIYEKAHKAGHLGTGGIATVDYHKANGYNTGNERLDPKDFKDGYASQYVTEFDNAFSKKASSEVSAITKTASQPEYIEVRQANKEDKLFNIFISYVDKTGKAYKPAKREFKNIPEMKLRGILKVIGYDIPKISDIIGRASREAYVKYPMPDNATMENLRGGQVQNQTLARMKAVKGKLFDSTVTDALAAEVLGQMLGGSLSEKAVSAIKKFSSEAEALSVVFEKLAEENHSEQALKVAKLMTAASILDNKVVGICGGELYPKMKEVVADVVALRPELEKTAYDLMALKAQQYVNRNHIVNPNYIQGAIEQLDNMYKIAATLHRKAGHEIKYEE